MAASKKPPKLERPPIRYRWNSVEGASFALADFIHQENTPTLPKSNSKCSCRESDLREVMGTPELISTVERIWNSANNLPFLKTKENLNLNHSGCQKNFNFSNLCEGETERLPPSDDFKCSIVNDQSLPSNIEFPKVTQKMSGLESLAKISSWRLRHLSNEAWRGMELTSVKYLNELRNVNQPIGEICCTEEKSNLALGDVNSNSDLVKSQVPPSCSGVHVADANVCLQNTRTDENFGTENENSRTEIPSARGQKLQGAGVKQEHAVAGALAGVFVSLSLHPVDTVKTIIQSCRADQKSIYDIGKSIISERGLSGLYRGIASNIASSAPISAEYSSVAHCVGAGCASVATSFIFTPSERVKQQMQECFDWNSSKWWVAFLVYWLGSCPLPKCSTLNYQGDGFKHHKKSRSLPKIVVTKVSQNILNDDTDLLHFGEADSDERLSDISDGSLTMGGTETDGSMNSLVEYTLFPESDAKPVKKVEKPVAKAEKSGKITTPTKNQKPPPSRLVKTKSSVSLNKSPSPKLASSPRISTCGSPGTPRTPRRWQ
ncbi:hypothetical protein ACFE04_013297 [Oxalis oulophora]